jgi:hypothetical protein
MEKCKLFFTTRVRIIAYLCAARIRNRLRAVAKGLLRNFPGLYVWALGRRISL